MSRSAAGLFEAVFGDSPAAVEHPLALGRGDRIFRQGDPATEVFGICSGKVKLHRSAAGREHLLAVLGAGEVMGEASLFDVASRAATATALTEAVVFRLSHSQLREQLAERPDLTEPLIRTLAARLRSANQAVADLVFADVPARLAKVLLDLGSRFGEDSARGRVVSHDLTQEELAQLVGASRETVNKALADFAGRGWIRLGGRALVISDAERLARRSC